MVEFERQNADVSYFELFKPKMINRTHIGVFTQIWSQLTGMNVMMYYISCKSKNSIIRRVTYTKTRRFCYGRPDWQRWPLLLIDSVCH